MVADAVVTSFLVPAWLVVGVAGLVLAIAILAFVLLHRRTKRPH